MIAAARKLNGACPNCKFILNGNPDLRMFRPLRPDLLHPRPAASADPGRHRYVADFARVLAPDGLLVYQIPSHIPLGRRLQLRRRLYGILRSLGLSPQVLYHRLGLFPMRMIALAEQDVRVLLAAAGAPILEAQAEEIVSTGIESRTYYATKVSRMASARCARRSRPGA
jgi:hypothetical protein